MPFNQHGADWFDENENEDFTSEIACVCVCV